MIIKRNWFSIHADYDDVDDMEAKFSIILNFMLSTRFLCYCCCCWCCCCCADNLFGRGSIFGYILINLSTRRPIDKLLLCDYNFYQRFIELSKLFVWKRYQGGGRWERNDFCADSIWDLKFQQCHLQMKTLEKNWRTIVWCFENVNFLGTLQGEKDRRTAPLGM